MMHSVTPPLPVVNGGKRWSQNGLGWGDEKFWGTRGGVKKRDLRMGGGPFRRAHSAINKC